MAVVYNATGAGVTGLNVSGSPAAGTAFNHTAASGADVFVAIEVSFTGSPTSVSYNGSAMTLLGSQASNNGSQGGTYLYRAAGAGTGSAQSVTYTIPATSWYSAQSVSYTGVGSVGSPIKNFGSSTSPSSGSITVGTAQLALCALGYGISTTASTMSAPTGGTNRSLQNPSTAEADLAVSDSTSTATFGATLSASGPWSSVAVVLSPTPLTISPTGASTAATGGVPVVTEVDPGYIQPGGAATTAVGGVPILTGPAILPGGPTLMATPGTPLVSDGFSVILDKLAASQDVRILFGGDSITYGVGDFYVPTFWRGWPGRVGILLATAFKANVANVNHIQWGDGGNTPVGYPESGATAQSYKSAVSIWSGSGSANINIVNAGVSGKSLPYQTDATRLPLIFASPAPDVIVLSEGVNDWLNESLSPSAFVTAFEGWLSSIQAMWPGVPIIVTNENPAGVAAGYDANLSANFAALFTALAGWTNVALVDTRSMFTSYTGAFTDLVPLASPWGSLHPSSYGYALEANGFLGVLAPGLINALIAPQITLSPTGVSTTAAAGTPAVTSAVSPIGATVTATPGVPVVTEALTISPAGASTIATPGTPVVTTPELISPTGTSTHATPGTPTVTAPDTVSPSGASTAATGGTPVVTEVTPSVTLNPAGASTAATGGIPDVQGAAVSQEIVIVPPSRSAVVWR